MLVKKLFLLLLFLGAPLASHALQRVPAYQVSFPTSATYNAIQSTTDDLEQALEDLDDSVAGIPGNIALIATNATLIATNATLIATNATLTATNATLIATNAVEIADLGASSAGIGIPRGGVLPFAATNAPTGWLECAGAAVSRTTYSNLYAVVGDLHGSGDGSTTFRLPDLRGRFVRGWDHGEGNDPDSGSRTNLYTGGSVGDDVGSYQEDDYEAHAHSYSLVDEHTGGSGDHGEFAGGNDKDYDNETTFGDVDALMGNETRPVNLYLMYCIKY